MLNENKGITLVALIITIIVMLILAAVSISLVVGENGVLTQATSAGDKQAQGEAEQAVTMAFADLAAQYYADSAKKGTQALKITEYYTDANITKAIKASGAIDVTDLSVTVENNGSFSAKVSVGKVVTVTGTITIAGTGAPSIGSISSTVN